MGRVGDELPLALAGLLEPAEHLVHGQARAGGSRRARAAPAPAGRAVAGDLLDLAPDALDRGERAVATIQVVPPTSEQQQREPDEQRRQQRVEVESSTSSSETATETTYSPASSVDDDVVVVAHPEGCASSESSVGNGSASGCEAAYDGAVRVGHLPDHVLGVVVVSRPRRPSARLRPGARTSRSRRPAPTPAASAVVSTRRAASRAPGSTSTNGTQQPGRRRRPARPRPSCARGPRPGRADPQPPSLPSR